MKKMNIIAIFDKDMTKILLCKRTKEPYKGMYNFVRIKPIQVFNYVIMREVIERQLLVWNSFHGFHENQV